MSAVDLGHFALVASWILALYGILVGGLGGLKNSLKAIVSARNAVMLTAVMLVLSLVCLSWSFVAHEFKYQYVWQNSNREMPWYYLISAVWGGMDGSMLLWAAFLGVYSALALAAWKSYPSRLVRFLPFVFSSSTFFFVTVVAFFTNPFRLIPGGHVPPDGNGLNPLLQNPSMLIHPPMLYAGFTGFVVPAGFCLAALLSGSLGDQWILLTRRWTLIAWGFLTAGIILGGNWAYIELGWGGFWAWDPVENASFFPWLTGTAYLHSVIVQERKGMLKVWNVSLCILTYTLSVFGTFLTRSGIVQSVHAFAETDVGWVFLLYIGILVVSGALLVGWRWGELKPERKLDSYLSREAAFLFNNLALLAICFATIWGVMFPVISEALTGEKSVVGPPFFNQVNVPLFLILLFLMGVGPLISWRRASWQSLAKTFAKPFGLGCVVTLLCLFYEPSRFTPALAFGLSAFVIFTVETEFRRGIKARRELVGASVSGSGLVSLVKRRPRRYGGFLIHLGVAIMSIAITASMAYKIEQDVTLKVGESAQVGRYKLILESLLGEQRRDHEALISKVRVEEASSGTFLSYLHPERRIYSKNEEMTTEVDIRITPRDDLYLALSGSDTAGIGKDQPADVLKLPAIFKVFINPLQVWLWFGGMVVLFGTAVVIGPALPAFVSESSLLVSAKGAARTGVEL